MEERIVDLPTHAVDVEMHARGLELIAGARVDGGSRTSRMIGRRLAAYARQDKRYERPYIPFTRSEAIDLLAESELVCFYCASMLALEPRKPGDKLQWTLDRTDNSRAHCKANCVVSCLGCNVAKKRRSVETFKFGKGLVVVKAPD